MWSERERDELAVWADRLQVEGERLGELVATSLLAERPSADANVDALAARVAQLEREVRDPMVAELLTQAPGLEPEWEHGVVVSMRVFDPTLGDRLDRPLGVGFGPGSTVHVLDVLREFLALPVARFLRQLRVDARGPQWHPLHRQVPALLADPAVVARPWSLILGAPPRTFKRTMAPSALAEQLAELAPALDLAIAPDRELRTLFVDTIRVHLPWQRGDKGTRLRAAARLADGQHDEATTLTRLARALWDPSLRVRLRILDTLPLLGVEAAPFVPELLLVYRGELEWVTRVGEVLAILARDPATVRAVALNFTADQPRCASWLAASPLAAAELAVPRLQAMLGRAHLDHWTRATLEQAQRRLVDRSQARALDRRLDPRTASSKPLLARLRRWLQV